VVHVLGLLHASLVERGILCDTQPVAAAARVSGSSGLLGRLDMSKWIETIAAIDERVEEAVAARLFRLEHEEDYLTYDEFDEADALVETVSLWRDTEIPKGLSARIHTASPPFRVEQHVRLRLFRRL
jgi:hypothetical protein